MYPNATSVTLSANVHDDPVILVSISKTDWDTGERKSMSFTAYNVDSMLLRLRASRVQISTFLGSEVVCRIAGEVDTWDEIIEQLLSLKVMMEWYTPFSAEVFSSAFKVRLPFNCRDARQLVKRMLVNGQVT